MSENAKDQTKEKFINMEEAFLDLANKHYENDEYEDGEKAEGLIGLIEDISVGYISKNNIPEDVL